MSKKPHLRRKLVKLGEEKPQLRDHLRPILDSLLGKKTQEDHSIKKRGPAIVIRKGNAYSVILHPEHQKQLLNEELDRFKDEQGKLWSVEYLPYEKVEFESVTNPRSPLVDLDDIRKVS